MKTKTIALIPARGGSKRIKNKNVIEFFGRPIISYSIEEAIKSKLFDVVHVSTDNKKIANIAKGLGADVSFMRDEKLADDFSPLADVCKWVLKQFEEKKGIKFDDVCTIFACAPFIEAADLKQAFGLYKRHQRELNVWTVSEAPARPEIYFHMEKAGVLEWIDERFKTVRTQDLKPAYFETGTFTIHNADVFTEGRQRKILGYELPRWKSVDIDTKDDLRFAEMLFKSIKG